MFLNEIVCILIKINFVPYSLINKNPSFLQIMAWYQAGDKPFTELNVALFTDAYMQ